MAGKRKKFYDARPIHRNRLRVLAAVAIAAVLFSALDSVGTVSLGAPTTYAWSMPALIPPSGGAIKLQLTAQQNQPGSACPAMGVHSGCGSSMGTFGMFTTDSNFHIEQYTSQYFASQLITQEWAQPGT